MDRPTAVSSPSSRRRFVGVCLVLIAGLSGCGYSLRPAFQADIETVYVPMFRSATFRRDLNFQLTDKVIHEIEKRSQYKVVGSPEGADTTLEGEISFTDKYAFVQNPQNLPRQLKVAVQARVTWTDNRPGREKKEKMDPVLVSEEVFFYPELGETVELAYDKALEKLARQIVNMMEKPW